MLIACHSCHRQYDAGSHEPGTKVRCLCGTAIVVPEQKARDIRMLHCSACGASLPDGSTNCDYCGAGVGLGEKGLGDVCPECMTRLVADAGFCSGCGVEIKPEAALHALTDLSCPRCGDALSEFGVPGTQLIECGSCAGLWLDEDTFEEMTRKREANAVAPVPGAIPKAARAPLRAPAGDVSYLSCPVCGDRMHRRNFAKRSGVIIDWCRGHGFWFDADELERISTFIDQGGLSLSRKIETDAQARAERSAAMKQAERAMSREIAMTLDRRHRRFDGADLLGDLVSFIGRLLR